MWGPSSLPESLPRTLINASVTFSLGQGTTSLLPLNPVSQLFYSFFTPTCRIYAQISDTQFISFPSQNGQNGTSPVYLYFMSLWRDPLRFMNEAITRMEISKSSFCFHEDYDTSYFLRNWKKMNYKHWWWLIVRKRTLFYSSLYHNSQHMEGSQWMFLRMRRIPNSPQRFQKQFNGKTSV